ncbi:MAG: orotate phosphoribosyltransferase [Lachnospiraceae bacterium]|jgi:orotate phosphoribosyltransferase|nr:orotate phosphoribosyltransferase [Lachnospiraceae bacterium]MCI8997033.1 orotate phosphoribosyltransferase [Lachnospiraceae bacterium]MCI9135235.1 orotate phosphoribosyltransferase [Lachnospiraceae bacterium]
MEKRTMKIPSKADGSVFLRVIPGHFATNHSHINHYIDMTTLKSRKSEAQGAAKLLAQRYSMTTIVDTIVCMDGCGVIGAYLADELQKAGVMSVNQHQTLYVVSPELDNNGQLIFRDNTQFMIEGKNVLLLLATATTGQTIDRALQSVHYYGGIVTGIAALFSAISKANGVSVNSIFSQKDLPDYQTYAFNQCPLCKQNVRVDAIVNGFGYSKL